jgi:hypothetical protein
VPFRTIKEVAKSRVTTQWAASYQRAASYQNMIILAAAVPDDGMNTT